MDLVHIDNMKIDVVGGDFTTSTALEVNHEKVDLRIAQRVIDRMSAKSPQPSERYRIGYDFALNGFFHKADLDTLVQMLGGANTLEVFSLSQGFSVLPKYDVQIESYRPSDGVLVPITITSVNFIGDVIVSFQHGQVVYLPFEAQGTRDTDLNWDNSVS